jgi:hypothetical protein
LKSFLLSVCLSVCNLTVVSDPSSPFQFSMDDMQDCVSQELCTVFFYFLWSFESMSFLSTGASSTTLQ